MSESLSGNEKRHFNFRINFGLSPNLGLNESLSERLIQKLKSLIVNTVFVALVNVMKEMTPQRDDVIKSGDVVLYDSLI